MQPHSFQSSPTPLALNAACGGAWTTHRESIVMWYPAVPSNCYRHELWNGVQERAESTGTKMATMESLAVYFILNEAREKLSFDPEEYGLSDDDAVTIARMFAKYVHYSANFTCSGYRLIPPPPHVALSLACQVEYDAEYEAALLWQCSLMQTKQ